MSHTLLLSNFGPRMTERDLYFVAVEQGLSPVHVMFTTDEETGLSLGVAQMQFASDEEANEAVRRLHKLRLHGIALNAELPRERPRRPGVRPMSTSTDASFGATPPMPGARPRYRDADFRKRRDAFDDDDE